MAFGKITAAALKSGKTVPYVLNMLPGKPTVHVEHLGETNDTFWQDQIARANTQTNAVAAKPGKVSKKTVRERRARDREALAKHAVRHLEAKHDDGRPATDDDIPEFVHALPDDVVDTLREFALNEENFREGVPEADPQELAEKS